MPHTEQKLNDINLLRARPTKGEVRAAWFVMGLLSLGFLFTVPFAARIWPSTNLLYACAGIAAFAEIVTGLLLLSQSILLRHYAGLALSVGYLLGGLVIVINLLCVSDVATRLWLFRLWHGVFVLGILLYALLQRRPLFPRNRFRARAQYAVGAIIPFILLLAAYLFFRPFPLPQIIHGSDYVTVANLSVNGIQFVAVAIAWLILVTTPRKTVLSTWMSVVAIAVTIDIVLFIFGGKLFSVGLYISKLNNLLAATLIFAVIFYRYLHIQAEMLRHRAWLVRANRQLARMALTDTLTGLPNRAALDRYLEQALAQASRSDRLLAVCVIDLDEFKPVNDQFGHAIGDQLLRAFAERLSALLRKAEFFARLGGDEFVLVLPDLEGMEQLSAVMDRITRALDTPFILSNQISLSVNASFGAAAYPWVEHGQDLLRAADQALYRSKEKKATRERRWELYNEQPMTS